MKKMVILLTALLMIAGFSGVSFALTIDGSKHDLGDDSLGTTEVCVFCHVPHNPVKHDATNYPLWNRADSLQTFTLYSGGTLDNSGGGNNNVSLLCLSCHDGVTNIDAFGGGAGTIDMDTKFAGTTAVVGTDLSDDHPVMVTYPGPNTDYKDVSGSAAVSIFAGNVECASCHNPHDPDGGGTGNGKFLRSSNDNSAMCLACHNK